MGKVMSCTPSTFCGECLLSFSCEGNWISVRDKFNQFSREMVSNLSSFHMVVIEISGYLLHKLLTYTDIY